MLSSQQSSLFDHQIEKEQSPVECLGMTFENDEARRVYFNKLLREKLQDPEFRKIEGFPIGEDEDILRLSDPPYYTACPNPFIADFVRYYGKPFDPSKPFNRAPFAADTGAGKTHPIYTAHSYHSKIPHLAIMPCILHYTDPGDIVFDGFSGSGMTGVAAQLCGHPEPEFKALLEKDWKDAEYGLPKWGTRVPILIDLSPVANFIGYNLNLDLSAREFEKAAEVFFKKIDQELGPMYETLHTDGKTRGRINFVVWSEVFTCPNCAGDVVFMDQAYDPESGQFAKEYECNHCKAALTNRTSEHKFTTRFDKAIGETVRTVTYQPVEIEYTIPGNKTKFRKKPDAKDFDILRTLEEEQPKDWFPTDRLPIGKMRDSNHLEERGITHYHQFYLPRALHSLSLMWRIAGEWPELRVRGFLKFMVEQCFWGMTMMNRYGGDFYSQVNRCLSGVFYLPTLISETSPWLILDGKQKRLMKILEAQQLPQSRSFILSTASSLKTPIPDKSVDYIFTDPPFGDAIKYGDLNLLIEAWHRLFSRLENEVLWDELKNKTLGIYTLLMKRAFAENIRILKPGHWMTLVFHNSKNLVWTAIQEALGYAGFVVADVRTLDRQQGSYNQVTAAGAVKQDLVISAYKPHDGLESRFKLVAGTEEGAWDFIRNHLKQLPIFVANKEKVEIIAERMSFLLFDRMVAFHVQRGVTVPLTAAEFYGGMERLFPVREGMYFLPDQVSEYDKMRLKIHQVQQLQLFVTDESSAILWLRQQLETTPQTYQDLFPKFIREISGWEKYEESLELSEILEQNFLSYDGTGAIPNQIWSWMKQDEEMRETVKGQSRENPSNAVRNLTKGRWFVPDPNNAQQLEKVREGHLLKEFDEYKRFPGKKMKVFRLEAVRAGFKKAWQDRDYKTIIAVAEKISEEVLQEDPKLLMWYDQALTRMEQ